MTVKKLTFCILCSVNAANLATDEDFNNENSSISTVELTFCILCSVNAANLATDEDFNNENSSISTVEENILINKNNWNTRKWGSIYFLFPHLSCLNIVCKLTSVTKSENSIKEADSSMSFWGKEKRMPLQYLNFLLSGIVEYKYMFHKYCGTIIFLSFL